ncbi:cytochrome P450 [Sulfitobacter sp. HNIBRBA3233]|uniref:cytochrome P450 n=1 Tax=Sulfitobacter marinivivus TaxID=3158558 RepID=UPI0032DF918B
MSIKSPSFPVRVPLLTRDPGLLRSISLARDNILSIIPAAALEEPIVTGRTGKRWHMVMEPKSIRRVLIERLDSYPKSDVTKSLLSPAIGESLFIAEGSHWRWQRRAAAPAFAHRAIRDLGPVMSAAAAACCDRIAQAGPRAVNMADEMVATTFDVIADVTFSEDDTLDRAAVHRAIDEYINAAGKISVLDVLGLPDWLPRAGRAASISQLDQTKRAADEAIARRHARGPRQVPDLLDHLLAAEDPKSGRAMTTPELRDNLLTFIVAGHETTAQTLAWALYLMGFDTETQARARAEAQAALGGRTATADDLEALPLVRQIIDETLRLYPAGGLLSRTARADDTLCGTRIRPGETVMIPVYALGRHRALWNDPDRFDPSRFAERSRIDRFAYLPFGDGPRVCIGASFALQEAVIILATLLSRFRFDAVRGRTPEPKMILTLRPEGGVWMTATPV